MKTIANISELKAIISAYKSEGKKLSLVPTMGNLHEGHISLVKKAKKGQDIVISSIFVNPTQFGPNEDFNKYPRTLKDDLEKLKEAGCDLVFTPSVNDIYEDSNSSIFVSEPGKSKALCGKFRSGHFEGVLTIVLKLFNICTPDKAYFGMKDYQQYILIKDMVSALNLDIEVIPCPIVRDNDGLALSSRNLYLSVKEKQDAFSLSRALNEMKKAFEEGETKTKILKSIGLSIITKSGIDVQYLEIVNGETLANVGIAKEGDLIAIAGFCGNTRLIDNIIL